MSLPVRPLEFPEQPAHTSPPHQGFTRRHRGLVWAGGIAGAVLLAAIVFLAVDWPFNEAKVARDLEEATSSTVQIGKYQKIYFPHPGCVAEAVVFRRGSNPHTSPLIAVQKLEIVGSYATLLKRHIPVMRAIGLRVTIPPFGANGSNAAEANGGPESRSSSSSQSSSSKTTVGVLIADGALLEFTSSKPGGKPLQFRIHRFLVKNPGTRDVMTFRTALTNPKPPGEIVASGRIGPWTQGDAAATPVSGSYSFRNANLAALAGIAGILSSDGKFSGAFNRLHVTGGADVPRFALKSSSHAHHLMADFDLFVDATHGDIFLHRVHAGWGATMLDLSGSIARQPQTRGKVTSLDLQIAHGRIEDVLSLFITAPRSPLTGPLELRAHAVIPPGQEKFVKKVEMQGNFGVAGAEATSSKTQGGLNRLSQQARGEKNDVPAENVLSDLSGHAILHNGVADFTQLAFRVPGALARMHGTYGLIQPYRVNLHGTLLMEQQLTKGTKGFKSFLLKALTPFLKKNREGGAKLRVALTGTYDHPKYAANPLK